MFMMINLKQGGKKVLKLKTKKVIKILLQNVALKYLNFTNRRLS